MPTSTYMPIGISILFIECCIISYFQYRLFMLYFVVFVDN